jgi:hypothetical protein
MSPEPSDADLSSTPPQAFQDNAHLVQAIAAGDRHAEQAFVDRYLLPVRAMLLARSRNPDLALDLRQDVMIEALCALRAGRLNDPEKLTQFVIGIARNLLNSHFAPSIAPRPLKPLKTFPIFPAQPRLWKTRSAASAPFAQSPRSTASTGTSCS